MIPRAPSVFLAALALVALAGCSTFTVSADLSQQIDGRWTERLDNRDLTHQPIARVAVGFEPALTQSLTATVGVEHRSYPSTGLDRGEERAYAGFVWKPFR